MEVRLLLAFLLMGAVMFLTPYIFKSQAPAPAKKSPVASTVPAEQAKPESQPPAAPAETAAAPSGPATSAVTSKKPLPPLTVETDLFRITFSNQGANARSWVLRKYKDSNGKPLDLVNTTSGLGYTY